MFRTLTLFLSSFLLSLGLNASQFSIKVYMPEGNLEYKVKNAIKTGMESAFFALPKYFKAGDSIRIETEISLGRSSRINVTSKLRGKYRFSERVSGSKREALILGKNLAIKIAEKILRTKRKKLSREDRAKMVGRSFNQKSAKQVFVFDFNGPGYSKNDLEGISANVRAVISESRGLEVKNKSLMENMMIDSEESKKECLDFACQIEIAGAMGVDEAVTGEIRKLGSMVTIIVNRVNIVSSSTIAVKKAKMRNPSLEDIVSKAESLARRLYGGVDSQRSFGVGLEGLGKISQVQETNFHMPEIDFAGLDINFLEAVQMALDVEDKRESTDLQKAEAWKLVQAYPAKITDENRKVKNMATKRQLSYVRVHRQKEQRKKKLAILFAKYKKDRIKLRKILALSDKIMPQARKKAYKKDFEKVYQPYEDVLDQQQELEEDRMDELEDKRSVEASERFLQQVNSRTLVYFKLSYGYSPSSKRKYYPANAETNIPSFDGEASNSVYSLQLNINLNSDYNNKNTFILDLFLGTDLDFFSDSKAELALGEDNVDGFDHLIKLGVSLALRNMRFEKFILAPFIDLGLGVAFFHRSFDEFDIRAEQRQFWITNLGMDLYFETWGLSAFWAGKLDLDRSDYSLGVIIPLAGAYYEKRSYKKYKKKKKLKIKRRRR